MNPMLNIAIRAARKAGNIIAKGYEQAPSETEVAQKSTNDYVTEIDKAAEAAIIEVIRKEFRLTPKGIIETLNLRRPIYQQTAAYGHFGRTDIELPWEQLNKVEELKAYFA